MEYSLCGVALRVKCVPQSRNAGVARILENLFSLAPPNRPAPDRAIELTIHLLPEAASPPEANVSGETIFDAPGLSAIRTAAGYHLRSHTSFLAVDPRSGRAAGSLSASFMDSSLEDQRGLFLFALLLLLSGRGLYGLHAAGVQWDGCGFLLVGGSGSGKTTITCALARSGWQYLSDDAVLLKRGTCAIEALAFGRAFHCAPATFRHFPELVHSFQAALRHGGAHAPADGKHLVDPAPLYPGRFLTAFRPRVLLFPEIAATPSSRLVPLNGAATLVRLLGGGAGLLHDRDSIIAQMAILAELAETTRGFRLMHGADVHHDPARVSVLLRQLASEGDYSDAKYSAA